MAWTRPPLACEGTPSELGTLTNMLHWKRTSIVVALLSTGGLAACGDGSDATADVADVTTTVTSAEPDVAAESTTTSAPADTTTSEPAAVAGGAPSAEEALREFMEIRSMGQNGRAWELLLPSQRALLDRSAYLNCQEDSSIDIVGVEVVDEYPERIPVAGLGEQDAVALTVKVTITAGGTEISQTDTFHVLSEADLWYVSLDEEAFACAQA